LTGGQYTSKIVWKYVVCSINQNLLSIVNCTLPITF
jgi:hypothetical protein